MLRFGVIPQTETTLVEISTKAGDHYYFGDAINACLLEGSEKSPSFWNLSAGAAKDPKIADKIKPDSAAAVASLKAIGVEPVMLTGDNQQAAEHVAAQVGITKVFGEIGRAHV